MLLLVVSVTYWHEQRASMVEWFIFFISHRCDSSLARDTSERPSSAPIGQVVFLLLSSFVYLWLTIGSIKCAILERAVKPKYLYIHLLAWTYENGKFTFCSHQGQSTVDYLLLNLSDFDTLSHFDILDFTENSDHAPFSCILSYLS